MAHRRHHEAGFTSTDRPRCGPLPGLSLLPVSVIPPPTSPDTRLPSSLRTFWNPHQLRPALPVLTLHSQVGGGRGGAPQAVARDAGVLPCILRLHPEDDQGAVDEDPHSQLQVTVEEMRRQGGGRGGGSSMTTMEATHPLTPTHEEEPSEPLRPRAPRCRHWPSQVGPVHGPPPSSSLLKGLAPGPLAAPPPGGLGRVLTSESRHSHPASTRCK